MQDHARRHFLCKEGCWLEQLAPHRILRLALRLQVKSRVRCTLETLFLECGHPIIEQVAALNSHLKDANSQPFRSFFCTDGEACILQEAFDPDVEARPQCKV